MKIMRWYESGSRAAAAGVFALVMAWCGSASAQILSIIIEVNENCNGTITGFLGEQPLPCTLQTDPGPGGLANAVTYGLLGPPELVDGDVVLQETAGGPISDIIRFNGTDATGTLVFYSDVSDGADALADIGFPTTLYTNNLVVLEVGDEGNNGLKYAPEPGQPGFVAGAEVPVVYIFLSDTAPVPEPATAPLLGIALACLGIAWKQARGGADRHVISR